MKRVGRVVAAHCNLCSVFAVWNFKGRCPAKIFLGGPCPGCGLTRAYLAVLRLDFSAAFRYHPLFPVAVPALLYLIHLPCLPVRLPRWAEYVTGGLLLAAFCGVYGYRMLYDPMFRAEGGVGLLRLIINQ